MFLGVVRVGDCTLQNMMYVFKVTHGSSAGLKECSFSSVDKHEVGLPVSSLDVEP